MIEVNYCLFCKKESNFKFLNILIDVLLVISFICFIFSLTFEFEIVVMINIVLWFIKQCIDNKDFIKKGNRVVIDRPIMMDEQNIYILQDKSITIVTIIAILEILFFFMLKINGKLFNDYIMMIIVAMFEVFSLLEKSNITYLKSNTDYLYNLLNNKNDKYKVNKVEKITRTDNDTYILTYASQVTMEVLFSESYENYNELINQLNQRCS